MLETLFGSKLRSKVLGWLFSHPDERYFVRQLTVLVKEDSTNVSRELARLEKTGILVSTTEGKQKYYQANRKSPVFKELKALLNRSIATGTVGEPTAPYVAGASGVAHSLIAIPRRKLAALCRHHHIRRLALFGSVLRDDFRPDSDVDMLVEFEPGKTPGFAFFGIQEQLSNMLGRKVDLNTPEDLSPYFRDKVEGEAKTLYAAR